MNFWTNLVGIYSLFLQFGKAGLKIVSNGTKFFVRDKDGADVAIQASKVDVSGDDIELGVADTGNELTLSRDDTQSGDLRIIFPKTKGSEGDLWRVAAGTASNVIKLEPVTPSGTTANLVVADTAFAFGSSSPITLPTLPTGALLDHIDVIPDEAFDGSPSMSIGISGQTSKYVPATAIDLTLADSGGDPARFTTFILEPPLAAPEALIATFSAGGATEGSGRIIVYYTAAPV